MAGWEAMAQGAPDPFFPEQRDLPECCAAEGFEGAWRCEEHARQDDQREAEKRDRLAVSVKCGEEGGCCYAPPCYPLID